MTELAFFGAFNPPTAAHLSLARFALEECGAQSVLFVPSRASYIRDGQGKDFAYSDEQRLSMLRAAAQSRPWMAVSLLDIQAPRQPRTYDTLCRLRAQGHTPALLMGSDKLMELESVWRHVPEIAREFGIVCLNRGGDDCHRLLREDPFLSSLAPYIRVLETPAETRFISSTEVRRKAAQLRALQDDLRRMVPPEILPLL